MEAGRKKLSLMPELKGRGDHVSIYTQCVALTLAVTIIKEIRVALFFSHTFHYTSHYSYNACHSTWLMLLERKSRGKGGKANPASTVHPHLRRPCSVTITVNNPPTISTSPKPKIVHVLKSPPPRSPPPPALVAK